MPIEPNFESLIHKLSDLFVLCLPVRYAPPIYRGCYYKVNFYVKIWKVRQGAQLICTHEAGGTHGKDPIFVLVSLVSSSKYQLVFVVVFFIFSYVNSSKATNNTYFGIIV